MAILPTGMIGPNDFGDSHLTRLVRDAATGVLPVSVRGGYDFVDVRDVAAGVIAAAQLGTSGRTYLMSGTYVPASKVVEAVAHASGRQAPPVMPLWVARMVAPLAEWISKLRGSAPIITKYSLQVLNEPGQFSSARAERELGYRSRPFPETLRDTVEWLEWR